MQIWNFKETPDGLVAKEAGFETSGQNGRAIALGFYDGVHLGHKKILDQVTRVARENNLASMVHTFSVVPKLKQSQEWTPNRTLLTTIDEKCRRFEILGLDEVALFPFSPKVSSMSAETFLDRYLKDLLHARCIVAGEDYRFGQNREGDMNFLMDWGKKNNIRVMSVAPLSMDGRVISSTWIRTCVQEGRVELAESLLGYPISYEGQVQLGQQLGRTLGFPTANISIAADKVVPAYGVYASVVSINNVFYPAITNIGLRPTVNNLDKIPLIETMIYHQNMDLYGQFIRVFLLSYSRPEHEFSSVDALGEQVHKDIEKVQKYHEQTGFDYSNRLNL